MPKIEKESENNLERIAYLESIVEDLESKVDSLKLSLNNNEEKIKNLELKTQDFSIAELFKGVGSTDGPIKNDIPFEIVKSLEKKFEAKMKLSDEKILKLDENNFKLTRQIQNVKNSHDLIKRNIDTFKTNIEDLNNKNENLDKKIDMNYDDLLEKLENKTKHLQKVINEGFDYINKNNISENKSNNSDNSIKNEGQLSLKDNQNMNNILNKNQKFLELSEKIKEIEEKINNMSTDLGIENIKNDIHGIKSGMNNFCKAVDFKELQDKAEDLQKQIKYNKAQFEDYINDKSDHEEIQTIKRKLELSINKTHEIETVLIELIKKIDQNASKNQESNIKNSKYLESKTFDEFKSQIIKEFSNINDNFTQSKKMSENIIESLKNRTSFKDLKVLEDVVLGKIEELKISSGKKFADYHDTTKTFKYLEQQIKYITQVFIKKVEKGDNWLLAKKPINSVCASCESYIGELKDTGTYIPWNKYPNNDKLYRLGNGFSKMLQMIQIDENEKKNMAGYQTYTDFNDVIKQIHSPLKTDGNISENQGQRMKGIGIGLPKIRKKTKDSRDNINSNNNNNEMPKVTNLERDEESEEEINRPKITKIYRMSKESKDNNI